MTAPVVALVFPGQGSQAPGMGKALAEAFPEAAEIFARADRALGRPISALCFEGTEEELRRTSNTQPALYTASAAALAALRASGIDGAMTAGHSLGEYTALHAAGALDFETGLWLVEARGRAMERAGQNRAGAMAALMGIEAEALEAVCREASAAGVVVPANWNSPNQVVISGEEAGVDRAIELAKKAGAKRAIKLNVGGAFHSPLMAEAARELREALAGAPISAPRLRFVANASAEFLEAPEAIRQSLEDQLVHCVRWSDDVRVMAAAGATHFIEVGPGGVLAGLIKRIESGAKAVGFGEPGQLEAVRAALA